MVLSFVRRYVTTCRQDDESITKSNLMKKKLRFDNGMLIRHCKWVFVVMMVHLAEMAFSQSVNVTGRVVSKDDGNPIPGVNVVIKNTSIGTTTDVDGNYTLSAPEDATLVFSFIG